MSFLAPFLLLGLAAIAVPIFVHLIQRERKDIVAFPSLMFIRRIPYQSVERRRIHNWLLLLLRVAAMLLIVMAFSRPFLANPSADTAAATGAREVVILLDRSASMSYGGHWTRAQDEAIKIVGGLVGEDRATLVLFDSGVEEAVRASSSHADLEVAIRQTALTSQSTKYAPALREAQSLLSRSDRGRKEAFLISDFQKTGWQRQEDIHLPLGATITPISVAEPETADLAVSSLAIQRASFSGEERATLTAGLINRSSATMNAVAVRLEIDGRAIDTRSVNIEPHASASVTFETVTVSEANMRGVVRATTPNADPMPKDNDFYFVLSPSRPLSILVLQPDAASRESSFYLSTALGLSKAPPFKVDLVAASRATPGQFDGRAVVVVNDTAPLPANVATALQQFVERGGGLLFVLGDRTPTANDSPLMPGALTPAVDRVLSGGTFGFLDYSHPILEQFKDQRTASFANARFLRYRTLSPAPTDRVLVRFDDGASALVERHVGSGRVLALASTVDNSWNTFPTHAMFLPLMHEVVRYLAQYTEPSAWENVGRMFDLSAPVASIVRQGQAAQTTGTARGGTGVVVSPSGEQVTLGAGGAPSIELAEQGFYSVRLAGIGDRRPYVVAVNLDPAESDLTPLVPTEFLAGTTGRGAVAAVGQSLEQPDLTPADIEKKQSVWWFLLVAGLAMLLAEAVLSNRLSRRFKGLVPA